MGLFGKGKKESVKNSRGASNNGEPRRYRIELSTSGVVASVVVGLLCLIWVFVLGVLLGRGYKPETAVAEMAGIPVQETAVASDTVAEKKPEVLKPEELQFMENLKRKPVAPETGATTAKAKAEPVKTASADLTPVRKDPAPAPAAVKESNAPEVKPVARKSAGSSAGYAYIFQCASFKNVKAAQELSGKIRKLGYSSNIESATIKGKTWHRVIATYKGPAEKMVDFKQGLAGIGIRQPFLKKRKPL